MYDSWDRHLSGKKTGVLERENSETAGMFMMYWIGKIAPYRRAWVFPSLDPTLEIGKPSGGKFGSQGRNAFENITRLLVDIQF